MLRCEFTERTFFKLLHQVGYLIRGGESKVILGQVDLPVPSPIFKFKDIKKKLMVLLTSLLSRTFSPAHTTLGYSCPQKYLITAALI